MSESSSTVDLLAALQRSVDAARADRIARDPNELSDRAVEAIVDLADADRQLREPEAERQRWERRIPGTDVAVEHAVVVVVVDGGGLVHVQESLLAQLLADAGWERTA